MGGGVVGGVQARGTSAARPSQRSLESSMVGYRKRVLRGGVMMV